MSDPVEESVPAEVSSEALYTVVSGEGDGAMLGLAAGDAAGGAWDLGYSAVTEQATIVAYDLIFSGSVDTDRIVAGMLDMDGAGDNEAVLRAESPEFRAWLDRAHNRGVSPGDEPSLDAAPRAVLVGVAFRREPERLVGEAMELTRLFHTDADTLASAVVAAAAAGASCFAQSGMDLLAGVAEVLDSAPISPEVGERVRNLMDPNWVTSGEAALERVGGGGGPLDLVLAGLALSAPFSGRPHPAIEQAAKIGGSRLGAVVGCLIGARVGIRAWPWPFANDTWFAEIGRRLVRGPRELRDLPIPQAVEQHLMSGERRGFH